MEMKIEDKAKGMDVDGRAKVIREVEILYKNRVGKFARIADPANGEYFWCAVLSLPWHAAGTHIATEEKLNMIGAAQVRDEDKAFLVRMLDNSQASIREIEYLPKDKAKAREWLHSFVFWLQISSYGSKLLEEIENCDRISLPSINSFINYVVFHRRKYFKKAFRVHQGDIKFSNDMDTQKGLRSATHRVVYR